MLAQQAAVRPARIQDKTKIGLADYLRGSQNDNVAVSSRFNAKSNTREEAFTLDVKALEISGGRHGNTNILQTRVAELNQLNAQAQWLVERGLHGHCT